MNLRNGFYILCCTLCLSLLASCLKNSDADEYILSTDAEILSFKLSHDSIPALDSVVFSIDQLSGLIYNHDSMAFGTDIYEKVIVTYESDAPYRNVLNVTDVANGDSTWVSPGDSLDVSKPVRFKVFAMDGLTTKYYWMNLNIHQVDPDSMQYRQVNHDLAFLNADETKSILYGGLYYNYSKKGSIVSLNQSTDLISWTSASLTGLPGTVELRGMQQSSKGLYVSSSDGGLYFSSNAISWQKVATEYPVKAVLGYLNASSTQVEGLTLIVEKEGKRVYAFTPNLTSFVYGSEVPEDFPVKDYSTINMVSMLKQRVTIVGGISVSGEAKSAVWSTLDGLYWGKLTDEKQGLFPVMSGANAFLYGDEIYLMNGLLENGVYNKSIYCSIDGGTTWRQKPAKYEFPADYPMRYQSSLVMDGTGMYFYIVGGRNPNALNDIWKGFQNKKTFR